MSKRAAKKDGKQASKEKGPWIAIQQLMLPMMLASDAIKQGLLAFVQQMGMLALNQLLSQDAESLAGPKGKHSAEREYHHWGYDDPKRTTCLDDRTNKLDTSTDEGRRSAHIPTQ